ncbi:oxysterol-binding protein-related protein 6-like [Zerene cesonia]|uniref:oxysterol-binding protein-related protein 6-like n=1 Tax=Zerene cesonia TaxID=33412 RepID=UPI0018E51911|nr:oxysterol-binding protein-related protein 6-like [Zerene cesonia]
MSNQTGLKHVATEPTRLESKRERRRGAAGRAAALRRAPSDSDCSGETASLSADSGERSVRPLPPPPRAGKTRGSRRRGSEWEVLEGLKDGQRFEKRPEVFNGYLHKKRKWPLKGWHKVASNSIYIKAIFQWHLRAKTPDVFRTWLAVLTAHRLYRQHLLTFGARESVPKIHAPLEDLPPTDTSSRLVSPTSGPLRGPQAGFVSGTPGGRLASWIIESGGPLDNVSRELGQVQLSVQQLQRLLDTLELQQQTHHDTDVSIEGASPNVKKDRRKFGLRKKKSNNKCGSVELGPHHIDPSSSHMALSTLTAPPSPGGGASSVPNSAASLPIVFLSTFLASTLVPCAATRPQSLPGAEVLNAAPASLTSLTPDHQLREDFTMLAKDLVTSLKSIVATLVCERGRLRAAMEAADSSPAPSGVVAALRTNLSTALQQNSELRSRLSRIHDASDLAEISSMGANSDHNHQLKHSLSYSSSCVSASEFFDAEEHDNGDIKQNEIINADETGVIELDGDSSSEAGSLSSEEGSASSDNSDAATVVSAEQTAPCGQGQWSRRRALPAPRPTPGGPSLWNLLYKNIGKDLSQISMPVTINEPLNMLQRLCEELEYSELLDAAAACADAAERMSLVAAFAVSAYAASAHRAASKPFNPLLAETYECVREDKRFRFLAEQVSHHPPISACHAESSRWVFWQEARIKTKFWGKSMEFQPAGRVHLTLLTTGDHYVWNKVTTCVHNLFGGQRWVDQYGDMHITCQGSDISCKLHFVKASSWSSSRHEVRGAAGEPPAARCLWRPGTMPPDYELYYGFTRFAMELNEMEPGMKETLPHTDTRFRPDQRALEEGDVEAAEQFKLELEQAQRERRRTTADHVPAWFRKSVEEGEETWVFGGEYWKAREAGFPLLAAPPLW